MSNTTAEFSTFLSLLSSDPERHPRLTAVDGAIGGWSADRIVATPETYWSQVSDRLRAQGLTPAQVQAAWMKEADAGRSPAYPGIYQWNVTLPAGVPTGSSIAVQIRYGAAVSNKVLLPD